MYKGKKVLAIIPARGGSKRLPGKNIKKLVNKPLINWTIEAAVKSEVFDEIMVNTDDKTIAEIALEAGATIPFIRKKELATDKASSLDVVKDTISFYRSISKEFDIVVLLQPTSPLRDDIDIINSINCFIEKKAASVLSVCEVDHPVQWCNTLTTKLSMDNFIRSEYKGLRSQDLGIHYRLNGAIYIWDCRKFQDSNEAIISPSFASIMDRKHSIDIDVELDFSIAEVIIKGTSSDK